MLCHSIVSRLPLNVWNYSLYRTESTKASILGERYSIFFLQSIHELLIAMISSSLFQRSQASLPTYVPSSYQQID
ncbi:hypothetical protein FOCG_18559 [Fusarium oxysporum f. sp. radicis-lycopersici 26381]|nr:hypothetical protein FOCG_18559 [Fusarium oxysporum f. sp. radicis-lycopersici 26381]